MKKNCWLLLLLIGGNLLAQKPQWDEEKATQQIIIQSQKMGAAFIAADYKTFATYTYPLILKSMGGSGKLAALLTKSVEDMKGEGMSLSTVFFDAPSKIVKSGKELQATIPQNIVIKTPQGSIKSTSTLIAFSSDNGVNWTFLDTSNKNMAAIRSMIPGISKQIIVPAQAKPVRYEEPK